MTPCIRSSFRTSPTALRSRRPSFHLGQDSRTIGEQACRQRVKNRRFGFGSISKDDHSSAGESTRGPLNFHRRVAVRTARAFYGRDKRDPQSRASTETRAPGGHAAGQCRASPSASPHACELATRSCRRDIPAGSAEHQRGCGTVGGAPPFPRASLCGGARHRLSARRSHRWRIRCQRRILHGRRRDSDASPTNCVFLQHRLKAVERK
jgi:hypothetical protein